MLRIKINGIVQGVGFRPFIYNLAKSLDLRGFILNSSEGVLIEVCGSASGLSAFLHRLPREVPPAAVIESLTYEDLPDKPYRDFEIRPSLSAEGITSISPDLAVCPDCITEMFDPDDHRYLYPFINCTNCGPRFSIIESVPYDRPATSMHSFPLCSYCAAEYSAPANRRFHAQPVACPECGPRLTLLDKNFIPVNAEPIAETHRLLKENKILGIKGISGFHLACLAFSDLAIAELRRRKHRPDKPFAVMCREEDLNDIVIYSAEDLQLLRSPAAPILILPAKNNILSSLTAPDNPTLGVFLPYAPLHYLLLTDDIRFLIMTSGNYTDEPVAREERELEGLCDFYLTHNRPIVNRSDDSVIRSAAGTNIFIRRSRGYVPHPLKVAGKLVPTFAAGASMKLTFALAQNYSVYLSPYISNGETKAVTEFYREIYERYCQWFKISPELAACDLQPDFFTTHFAESLSLPLMRIQHHQAHLAAVIAEHNISEPVLGIAYDGTGYGTDAAIWGGEIMLADKGDFQRLFHLQYLPLPGGDAAIRHPDRIAFAYLKTLNLDTDLVTTLSPYEKQILEKQIDRKLNTFPTSSLGRLFDCISALLGVCYNVTFEGQSAMALEYACRTDDITHFKPYSFSISNDIIELKPLLTEILQDISSGKDVSFIASRFHRTVLEFTLQALISARHRTGILKVVLAGGVMQNALLLSGIRQLLRKNNFTVYLAEKIPPNDGSIALGQLMIANYRYKG
ncbi:MAG: carbamoyltransferase HypF [Candidatus Cloacimonetes bacterium]|nr:carbamoyltransferase HypF [Candidatus Cloacimonadota bacterium]